MSLELEHIKTWLKNPKIVALLLFLVSFIFYVVQVSIVERDGDCAVFITQIENSLLDVRTPHFGFFALGILLSKFSPFPTDLSLNIMSSVFGALGVAMVYLIVLKLTKNHASALVSASILAASGLYWLYSLYADVRITQTFFIILTYLLWVSKREYLSGLAFLWAMLVTPLSACCLPGLVIDAVDLKTFGNRIKKFVIASAPLYAVFLIINWNDFWYGSWGVVTWSGQLKVISFYQLFRGLIITFGTSFYLSSFLILFGIIAIIFSKNRESRMVLYGLILCFIMQIIFLRATGRYYIPLFPLVIITAGVGFKHLLQLKLFNFSVIRKKMFYSIIILMILLSAVFSGFMWPCDQIQQNTDFRELCFEVDEIRSNNSAIVSDTGRATLFAYYTGAKNVDLDIDMGEVNKTTSDAIPIPHEMGIYTYQEFIDIIEMRDEIWILGINATEGRLKNFVLSHFPLVSKLRGSSSARDWMIENTNYTLNEVKLKHGTVWVVYP